MHWTSTHLRFYESIMPSRDGSSPTSADLLEQFLDGGRGRRAPDPGVESFEISAGVDLFARIVRDIDAASRQERQHRAGFAGGLTLGPGAFHEPAQVDGARIVGDDGGHGGQLL